MMEQQPFVLHPLVAQEVGLLHLQLAMANQRVGELQAELEALKAGQPDSAEPTEVAGPDEPTAKKVVHNGRVTTVDAGT